MNRRDPIKTQVRAGIDNDPEGPLASIQLLSGEPRRKLDARFRGLCVTIAAVSVLVLIGLLASILLQGVPSLSLTLLTGGPEPDPSEAGIRPAILGTLWVCSLCALFTLPIGVATAILLEEFQPRNRYGRFIYSVIQLNISNLAGVPSVVYGLLGLTAFVSMFGLFGSRTSQGGGLEIGIRYYDQFFSEGMRSILIPVSDPSRPVSEPVDGMQGIDTSGNPVTLKVISVGEALPTGDALQYTLFDDAEAGRITKKAWYHFSLPLGRGVLTGALTLMLVILPVIIISSQEALRAVPSSLRDGALGLGSTPWQVVWHVTLPSAMPGILTGAILAMSRAIGETAPILIIAGIVYISRAPQNLMDDFTVMPLQIFNWISRPQEEFHSIAAAGILLLLGILLSFNALAVLIRQKLHKPLS
ncbi:MAG TPA: phosphate ABC transporter permease [Planctomycetaceae bacterium]|nr:phosphate ABC transporter permease [Planctomycetaceae bacterium]